MKTKIVLLLIMLANVSCVNWTYVLIQNRTSHDIRFDETITLDWPQDSSSRKYLLEFHPNGKIEQGKFTVKYSRLFGKDSLYCIDLFISKRKSKNKLIDSSQYSRSNPFMIISNSDTILFTPKEIEEKVNKLLIEKESNTSVKTPDNERNLLIWELNDSDLLR